MATSRCVAECPYSNIRFRAVRTVLCLVKLVKLVKYLILTSNVGIFKFKDKCEMFDPSIKVCLLWDIEEVRNYIIPWVWMRWTSMLDPEMRFWKLKPEENPNSGLDRTQVRIGSDSTNERLFSKLSLCSRQNAVRSAVTRRWKFRKFKLYVDTLFS